MEEFRFTALGTEWTLLSDGKPFSENTQKAIREHAEAFEDRFSRFRDGSETNAFRTASAGRYAVSPEMEAMLQRAAMLRELTEGGYDPAIAPILEMAGYDKYYRFTEEEHSEPIHLPHWKIEAGHLVLDGPASFDFGGIGKGWCIDRLADVLRREGHEYFLVDGGGDMYGTYKSDGSSFRIALEWPGQAGTSFGTLELMDQGLAVSDSFRRRWGKWHHIVNPATQAPVAEVTGAAAAAKTAWDADCATAALFQLPEEKFPFVREAFGAEHVVFQSTGKIQVSQRWPGELFF